MKTAEDALKAERQFRPEQQTPIFGQVVWISHLKKFFFKNANLFNVWPKSRHSATLLLATKIQICLAKNFFGHLVNAIKRGISRNNLRAGLSCAQPFWFFIKLHWALCNKIRAHIGTTYIYPLKQSPKLLVEGASRLNHSAHKLPSV